MNLFFHTSAPKVLLALLGKKRLATRELIEASEAGGSWYSSRISDHLKEMGLIKTKEIRKGRKLTVLHELTPKGELVAQKLALTIDEEKEVYPISKKKLIELKDLAKHEGISWQELVTQTINEKLKELKEKLRLRDT